MESIKVALVNNRVGISAGWFMEVCGLKKCNYDALISRGHLTRLSRGGGKNQFAVIQWSNMPEQYRNIVLQHCNPDKLIKRGILDKFLSDNSTVRKFFADYVTVNGDKLDLDVQREYYSNAVVLNAVGRAVGLRNSIIKSREVGDCRKFWDIICDSVVDIDRSVWCHSLPASPRRLAAKYKKYQEEGLVSLVHSNFCNQLARKVDERLERLLLSLYCRGNKPYGSWVHEDYLLFLSGEIDIVDTESGEMFDRSEFVDKKGFPLTVSEQTVWNYINNPLNRAVVDSIRMGYHKFGALMRPHYHRTYGKYSLSKISLDDRDLPRKLHNGNRVKAYYAYDVMSGALIGAAYSLKKDGDLFIDCLRDMFLFIYRNGFGMPLEAEVENHLVRQFEPDLMRAGVVFPMVRWCAPTNSQEKHAEQFNRQKKYGFEKRYQDGIGRHYLKDKSNQTDGERVYDDSLHKYVIREKTYCMEQLIADDRFTIEAYNNGLHRDQLRFKGKTRLEVLRENLNPELVSYDRPLLARYIGFKEDSSVRRNMYCRVQYADYMLPTADVLRDLAPGKYDVQVYYFPEDDGNIGEVYLYQNDKYLCTAKKIVKFTTSQAEWTEVDTAAMTEQAKYVEHFDKVVRDDRGSKIKKLTVVQRGMVMKVLDSVDSEDYKDLGVVDLVNSGAFGTGYEGTGYEGSGFRVLGSGCDGDGLDDLIKNYTEGVRERALECV